VRLQIDEAFAGMKQLLAHSRCGDCERWSLCFVVCVVSVRRNGDTGKWPAAEAIGSAQMVRPESPSFCSSFLIWNQVAVADGE